MRKIAVPKAFSRNAEAFARSSSSPFRRKVTPWPRSVLASSAVISSCTFALCTPSATFDDDRHHAVAADAVDVTDARRRNALDEIADRHVAGGGVDAQVVDLVEAPAILREAQQDIDLLVGFRGPIFGDLHAVGDELHRGADTADARAVFRGFRLVDLDAPVDAGQRQAVVEIADVGALRQNRGDLFRRRRQQLRIERAELDLDRLAGRRAGARAGDLGQDAGNIRGLLADLVHDLVRGGARLPVGEFELDDADRVLGDFARAARLLADAGIDGA